MTRISTARIAATALLFCMASASAQDLRVSSEQTVGGFAFPESVGCDLK